MYFLNTFTHLKTAHVHQCALEQILWSDGARFRVDLLMIQISNQTVKILLLSVFECAQSDVCVVTGCEFSQDGKGRGGVKKGRGGKGQDEDRKEGRSWTGQSGLH